MGVSTIPLTGNMNGINTWKGESLYVAQIFSVCFLAATMCAVFIYYTKPLKL